MDQNNQGEEVDTNQLPPKEEETKKETQQLSTNNDAPVKNYASYNPSGLLF